MCLATFLLRVSSHQLIFSLFPGRLPCHSPPLPPSPSDSILGEAPSCIHNTAPLNLIAGLFTCACHKTGTDRRAFGFLTTKSYRAWYLEHSTHRIFEKKKRIYPNIFSELKEVISLNFCQKGESFYSEPI